MTYERQLAAHSASLASLNKGKLGSNSAFDKVDTVSGGQTAKPVHRAHAGQRRFELEGILQGAARANTTQRFRVAESLRTNWTPRAAIHAGFGGQQ